jgi:hypothetical protein
MVVWMVRMVWVNGDVGRAAGRLSEQSELREKVAAAEENGRDCAVGVCGVRRDGPR